MTNYLLYKHNKVYEQFVQPEGLTELLSDITREVLREQPECTYTFIADYLDAMLLTREQTLIVERTGQAIISISMTVSDLMREAGFSREDAQTSAEIIDGAFRHMICNDQHDDVRQRPPNVTVAEADVLEKLRHACGFTAAQLPTVQHIIQVCYKEYYFHEREFTLKQNRLPWNNWANRVEHMLDVYRTSGASHSELVRAATCIQSAWRSYDSRAKQHQARIEEKSAVTIQANYRGHLVRRKLPSAEHERKRKQQEHEEKSAIIIQSNYRGHLARIKQNRLTKTLGAAPAVAGDARSHDSSCVFEIPDGLDETVPPVIDVNATVEVPPISVPIPVEVTEFKEEPVSQAEVAGGGEEVTAAAEGEAAAPEGEAAAAPEAEAAAVAVEDAELQEFEAAVPEGESTAIDIVVAPAEGEDVPAEGDAAAPEAVPEAAPEADAAAPEAEAAAPESGDVAPEAEAPAVESEAAAPEAEAPAPEAEAPAAEAEAAAPQEEAAAPGSVTEVQDSGPVEADTVPAGGEAEATAEPTAEVVEPIVVEGSSEAAAAEESVVVLPTDTIEIISVHSTDITVDLGIVKTEPVDDELEFGEPLAKSSPAASATVVPDA